MSETGAVFAMLYLPPVAYFTELKRYRHNVIIEKEEHFPKQTYRNRASMYSPDGVLDLVVPVVKGSKGHTQIKDVRISYDFNWQRLHWMSLQACYRRSAYFEYYEDTFAPYYERKFNYLFDYNEQLLNELLRLMKFNIHTTYTEDYKADYTDVADFRDSIHPKKASDYPIKPYFQVFEERQGWKSNLSVIDLLFSQGPQAVNYF